MSAGLKWTLPLETSAPWTAIKQMSRVEGREIAPALLMRFDSIAPCSWQGRCSIASHQGEVTAQWMRRLEIIIVFLRRSEISRHKMIKFMARYFALMTLRSIAAVGSVPLPFKYCVLRPLPIVCLPPYLSPLAPLCI